jgi:anti-sigma B factor antagonist
VNLAVTTEDAPQRRTIVRLCGELDIAAAPEVRDQLLAILDRGTPSWLVLDLSGLEFMDSSGTAVLVNTDRRARLMGCAVVLVAPRQPVLRVLQICGLDRHFLMFENIAVAMGTGQAGAAAAEIDPACCDPRSLQGVYAVPARFARWHPGYRS